MSNNRNIEIVEFCDIAKLAAIIENYETYPVGASYDHKTRSRIEGKAQIDLLTKYLSKQVKQIPTSYFQSSKVGAGKAYKGSGRYTSTSMSLQGMARPIRHTILKDYVTPKGNILYDFDMGNAHPTLLYQYCENNDIDASCLKYYVENKKSVRKEVAQHMRSYTPQDKSETESQYLTRLIELAKTRLLCMLNGDDIRAEEKSNPIICSFHSGISQIHKEVKKLHPAFYEKAKKAKKDRGFYNLMGTTTNYLMCDLENECLMAMYDYINDNKHKLMMNVISLQFDGMIIEAPQSLEIDETCTELSRAIKTRTGYDLSIEHKPFNEGFDIAEEHIKNVDVKSLIAEVDANLEKLKDRGINAVNSDFTDYIIANKSHHYISDMWYVFDEDKNRWLRDTEDRRMHIYVANLVKSVLGRNKTESFYTSIVQGVKNRGNCDIKFDRDQHLLGFDDVVLNLLTGEQIPYSKDVLVSMSTGCNLSDVKNTSTNIAEEALKKIYTDPDVRQYVISMLSCALHGVSTPVMHFNHGPGSNAKSLLTSALRDTLGQYGHEADPSIINYKQDVGRPQPHVVNMAYARLVVMEEPDANVVIKENLIKGLVGGEIIHARALQSNVTQHPNMATIFMNCNTPPNVDHLTDGGRRRIRIIPHESKFIPGAKDDYEKKIFADDKSLLFDTQKRKQFGMSLLAVLLMNPSDPNRLAETPKSVEEQTTSYLNDMCPIVSWFKEMYPMRDAHDGKIMRSQLKDMFQESQEYAVMSRADKRSVSNKSLFNALLKDNDIAQLYVNTGKVKTDHFKEYSGSCAWEE